MFTVDNANEIFNQMGGKGIIKAFCGTKYFTYSSEDYSAGFDFKGSKKFTHVTIKLNSLDLYDIRFVKCGKFEIKAEKTINNIYADQLVELFEKETGLYLHF